MQIEGDAAASGAIRLANRPAVEAKAALAVIGVVQAPRETGPRIKRRETGAQIRFEPA